MVVVLVPVHLDGMAAGEDLADERPALRRGGPGAEESGHQPELVQASEDKGRGGGGGPVIESERAAGARRRSPPAAEPAREGTDGRPLAKADNARDHVSGEGDPTDGGCHAAGVHASLTRRASSASALHQ